MWDHQLNVREEGRGQHAEETGLSYEVGVSLCGEVPESYQGQCCQIGPDFPQNLATLDEASES